MGVTIALSLLGFNNRQLWSFLALVPFRMRARHEYHPIVTAGFIHGSGSHLALNMMTLYFFGPALELTAGSANFLGIYLISIVVGNLYPFFKYRNVPSYVAIGASGGISGVLFSLCMARPTDTYYVFFMIPMPAYVFAVLYTAYSIYAMRKVQDNIGHEAHLAGAIGGIVATFVLVPQIITIFSLFG
ncbi:MAG: rhomboid family intrarane serine protease [Chlorobi bacterium]|nr:rhomboid family intrarane serine protease [Chlorobiota bacterium]